MKNWIIVGVLIAAGMVLNPWVTDAAKVPGVTDKEIVIGNINPLTGGAASSGIGQLNGLQLAAEEINAAGGIHGRKIKVVALDSECNPTKGVAAVRKLIGEGAFAVTGEYCSGVAIAINPIFEKEEVPMVYSGCVTSKIVYPKLKWVFHGQGSSNQRDLSWGMAKFFVEKLEAKKIAFVYQANELGENELENTKDALKKMYNMDLVAALPYNMGDSDFTAQVTKVKESGADVMHVSGLVREGLLIVRQARELGYKGKLTGGTGISTGGFFEAIGDFGMGMVLESTCPKYEIFDVEKPMVKYIKEQSIKRYGSGPGRPNHKNLTGYYSMKVVGEGLRRAGRDLTRDKFIKALETMYDVDLGIGNPVTFSPWDHEAVHTLSLYVIATGGVPLKLDFECTVPEEGLPVPHFPKPEMYPKTITRSPLADIPKLK
jgi:branched-chain amino acid transport system substrate-binding protein